MTFFDRMYEPAPYLYGVYLAGSLRNPAIPQLHKTLAEGLNTEVFSDWYSAGPEADDYWKEYYSGRGMTYAEALKQPASINTFEFDRKHMHQSRTMVLALPAGKSGHLELGWFLGSGRPGFILLDEPDRWDVMYQFATGVTADVDELIGMIRPHLNMAEGTGTLLDAALGRINADGSF